MSSESLQEIIKRKLKKQSKAKYSPALRSFALTLNFYSAKAYEYVRSSFGNILPHPKTISQWYRTVDGKPGFTSEALKAIRLKVESGERVIVNLVLDEMSMDINILDLLIWGQSLHAMVMICLKQQMPWYLWLFHCTVTGKCQSHIFS